MSGTPVSDPQIAVVVTRLDTLSEDLQEIRRAMRDLVATIGKLGVIEADQRNSNAAIERAFKELEKVGACCEKRYSDLDRRIKALEDAQPLQRQSSDWVQKFVGLLVAAAMGALVTTAVGGGKPVMLTPQGHPAATIDQRRAGQ